MTVPARTTAAAGPAAPGDLDDAAARERWYRAEGWWTGETLPGYVLRHCQDNPAAEAVTGAGTRLSRGELARQVMQAGESFRRLGVRPGERVLVQLPNEPELIVVILALAHIGAAAVLAVPGLRERELRHVTDVARACAIVVGEHAQRGVNLEVGRRLAASCRSVRDLIVSGTSAGPGELLLRDVVAGTASGNGASGNGASGNGAGIGTGAAPEDVALYLLSGGTTGLPKLIPRTHRDYVYNLKVSAAVAGLDAASRYLAALPVCHNFPLGCPGVLGTLACGGTVVLTEARLVAEALALMAEEGITITAAVPSLAVRWAEQARLEPAAAGSRLKLAVLQVGGARLRGSHAPELAALLGCTVQQVFGMAEGLLCFTRLADPAEVISWTQGRPASPGDEWRLTDETGREVPAGEPGELLVRGPYTIGGYLASEAENEAAFAAGGWYRTGDIVRPHPSGNFVVEGRRKDFINSGGEKISAEEVEELAVAHPSVALAAAVAAPSELLGEEVCVFATLRPGGQLTVRDLRRYLAGRGMAPYKLPARLRILGELPVTAVGKVDKVALRALARDETGKE
jgi:2,3-dihydroxybenzoate-AMP ligase